jgi:quercetin 2,3-dioxygenase
MKNRSVERLMYADVVDMGGMPVRQPFPTQNVVQIDPFLLLHHYKATLSEHTIPERSGVDPHPHRGFSSVTFVYKGGIHHRDSRGNNNIVYAGGTQWLNAGRGIVHSERPPADIHERGGEQEIIQLWVNLPQVHKMDQPEYISLRSEETPLLVRDEGKIKIQVVAGEFEGTVGPIKSCTPVLALRVELMAESTYSFTIPPEFNSFIYFLDGRVKYQSFGEIEGHHLVMLDKDGEGCTITARKDTRFLLMAGLSINEPVVSHGPFVMNSQTEIMQAMRDYQMGKMGILIE